MIMHKFKLVPYSLFHEPWDNTYYKQVKTISILSMLIPDISICFGNSVDPDQLASEKPADQEPHCFPTVSLHTTALLNLK